jgi:hypothetical protein
MRRADRCPPLRGSPDNRAVSYEIGARIGLVEFTEEERIDVECFALRLAHEMFPRRRLLWLVMLLEFIRKGDL